MARQPPSSASLTAPSPSSTPLNEVVTEDAKQQAAARELEQWALKYGAIVVVEWLESFDKAARRRDPIETWTDKLEKSLEEAELEIAKLNDESDKFLELLEGFQEMKEQLQVVESDLQNKETAISGLRAQLDTCREELASSRAELGRLKKDHPISEVEPNSVAAPRLEKEHLLGAPLKTDVRLVDPTPLLGNESGADFKLRLEIAARELNRRQRKYLQMYQVDLARELEERKASLEAKGEYPSGGNVLQRVARYNLEWDIHWQKSRDWYANFFDYVLRGEDGESQDILSQSHSSATTIRIDILDDAASDVSARGSALSDGASTA